MADIICLRIIVIIFVISLPGSWWVLGCLIGCLGLRIVWGMFVVVCRRGWSLGYGLYSPSKKKI